jgi:hypothetical protein
MAMPTENGGVRSWTARVGRRRIVLPPFLQPSQHHSGGSTQLVTPTRGSMSGTVGPPRAAYVTTSAAPRARHLRQEWPCLRGKPPGLAVALAWAASGSLSPTARGPLTTCQLFNGSIRHTSTKRPVSRPGARGHTDHGATRRDQPAPHCSISGAGAGVFLSAGVFPAPSVDLGTGVRLAHLPAGPSPPAGAGAPGGRRHGHRAPWPPGVRHGAAPRWGAVDPQRYRLPRGAYMGGGVGARHAAVRHPAPGAPRLGGLGPAPRRGSACAARASRRPRPAPGGCWRG